ncbi:DNA mismatch repair protein MutS [Haloferacaceae archaeon DSL9]
MTTATGPPATMAEKRAELTPMLRQYLELCETHEDALVLFQVGDFYEAFCEAAEEVARVCEVTLTQREDSTGTYPMAGVPISNAASYLERLLDAGYRIALADQIEDAADATGLVDRAVTRIITPGTVVDDELLSNGSTNYLACVVLDETDAGERAYALAAIDVSTGECFVTSARDIYEINEELDRVAPNEMLVGPDTPSLDATNATASWMETACSPELFAVDAAVDRLSNYVGSPQRRFESDAERRACGAVLGYAEYTQGDDGPLEYVSRIRRLDRRDHLRLDAAALRSLELFENRDSGSGETLFDVLDETASALGRRCLARWLRRPLVDRDAIADRHDAVDALAADSLARDELAELLASAYDLERLAGRISRGRANARDLRSLHATLAVVPDVREVLSEFDRLSSLRERLDPLSDVHELIDGAILPDPSVELTEGDLIRDGYDDRLDELRTTAREGREWIANLEAGERERTGIDSLSVGHNQVHGYYIEVTNPNLDAVPDDYTRRQTLKNSERFYTPELKQREDEIFGAAERADALEYELFCEVRSSIAAEIDRIQRLAGAVAEVDALCSLATAAVKRDYVRPGFHDDPDRGIEIEGGRHPVVETTREEFVPNDADLRRGDLAIITGPNMSGKSTYMRQVALTVLLAQVGSFVPVEAARLPIVDRIFTRIGASDDIAGGQSTFMREMSELTEILHDATDRSLVLLDEVGRGTSTVDGRAIARATTEFIHDELGAMTLFATHYHDLTDLADSYDGVFNLHFAATREGGTVTFLHRIAPGASSSSYGVEVARMAGVPDSVVVRARELVDAQGDDRADSTLPSYPDEDIPPFEDAVPSPRRGDRDAEVAGVLADLESLDIAHLTPVEALTILNEMQLRLE